MRLGQAADFIYKSIDRLEFANINCGCTAIFGMHLLGKLLDRPQYLERSRQLAAALEPYIYDPSGLLVGEGEPATGTSPRGCRPVDLGYNVEESPPAHLQPRPRLRSRARLRRIPTRWHTHLPPPDKIVKWA